MSDEKCKRCDLPRIPESVWRNAWDTAPSDTTMRQWRDQIVSMWPGYCDARDETTCSKPRVDWRARALEAAENSKVNGEIISKVNDAINRAGIHCALYFWEAIDQIASERDQLRAECDRLRAVYEAACAWADPTVRDGEDLWAAHCRKVSGLTAAIDAAREGKSK